jgi:hypothetical protein
MLDPAAQDTLEYFGGLNPHDKPDAAYIAKWRGRIPESLLGFWAEMGFGTMAEGSLTLCRPEDYAGMLAVLFGADPDFNARDCHLVAFSAFSDLYIWSERLSGEVTVTLPMGWVICSKLTDPNYAGDPQRAIWAMMASARTSRLFDWSDEKDKPLYKRARKKLGALTYGEVYGFVPALMLGGTTVLENLRRLRALEHFSILAQLDTPNLMDFKSWPPQFVRKIG